METSSLKRALCRCGEELGDLTDPTADMWDDKVGLWADTSSVEARLGTDLSSPVVPTAREEGKLEVDSEADSGGFRENSFSGCRCWYCSSDGSRIAFSS